MPRSVETLIALSNIPLFSELGTRQLSELSRAVTWHDAADGDVVMREGEPGDAMYFIVTGAVRVEVATADAVAAAGSAAPVGTGARVINHLGAGEPLGEMALFDDAARSATVVATERTRLGRIDRAEFAALLDDVPGIAVAICRVLSRRLREQNRASG